MKCKVCGQELPERAKFCYACGAPIEDVPAPKKLEEPLGSPLTGGAVPMVPVAPPPRATRVEPRAVRVRAARAVHPGSAQGGMERRFRETVLDTDSFPEQDLPGARAHWGRHAADVEEGPVADEAAPADGAEQVAAKDAGEETEVMDAVPEPSDREGARPDAPAVAEQAPGRRPVASSPLEEARSGFSGAMRDAFGDLPEVERGVPRGALVAALAVAALVVVALIGFVSTSWLGPLASPGTSAPEVQPPSDGSIAPLGEDEEDEAPDDGDTALPEDAPEPRAALADYSWAELSQIADLIAAADTDAEAEDIAVEYNLCAADGSLDGSDTKDLELADGTTVAVRIAGFRHDELADGSGVAGITFIAEAPLAEMAMCPNSDKGSGWRDTTLREWMNGELMDLLPEELSGAVVTVSKLTNPVAGTGTEQIVTEDSLWLPSYSELTGTARSGSELEGEQYQLFADLGVDGGGATEALALDDGTYWWERSPDPSNEAWFMCVGPDGAAATSHRPATPNGVVAGFCL